MRSFSVIHIFGLSITVGVLTILLKSKGSDAAIAVDSPANEASEILARFFRSPRKNLQSKKFEELGCPNVNPASNLKLKWITTVAAWYVPMASAHYYHTWVERLTNHSATGNDISNLCLKLLFLASKKPNQPYMVVAGGLKKSVVFKCLATGPHNQNCDGVAGAPDYQPGIDAYETVVATDNTKYILILRCIRNKVKSWFVMSPVPESLTNEVKKIVVGHVNKMGFNPKLSSMIPYNTCPKGKVDPRKG